MDFESFLPLLWLPLLVPLLAWAYARSLVKRPLWLLRGSFLFRLLALLLLLFAFCRPSLRMASGSAHVVFLLDVSESVDVSEIRKGLERVERLTKSLRAGDSHSFFLMGDGLRAADPEALKEDLRKWELGASDDKFRSATRIADSLLSARLDFPSGKARRAIVLSDGVDTGKPSALREVLARLKAEGVDARVADLKGSSSPEAALLSFSSPVEEAFLGEAVRFDARALANSDMTANLRILNRGVVMKELPLKLRAGVETKVSVEMDILKGMDSRWSAELLPERDRFPMNDKASCEVFVKGASKVLALHVKPRLLRSFAKALREQDVEVETRGLQGMPASLRELLEFDAIALLDFPATAMSSAQMRALRSYVKDYGGGLLMCGSENSFGLGGYFKTPVEDVLPLLSRYEKEREKPGVAIVFVIDKSGSMEGEKIALAREAAKSAAQIMGRDDYVGVVAFDGEAWKVLDISPLSIGSGVEAAIDSIAAGGGTNMYPGMDMAREMLSSCPAKIKHAIVLTDGQSQPGDFLGLASRMASESMSVSTVALGGDADRELLAKIAELGKGRHYEAAEADAIPRIFTKEAMEASRSAIKEEPFLAIPAEGADFLSGVDFKSAPPLLGYVMTRARPASKVHLLTESGDPLLACARFGLGSSAAFSSGVDGRWASEWLSWPGYGKFWSQLLRSIMRRADASGVKLDFASGGKPSISARDEAGRPRDFVEWELFEEREGAGPRALATRQIGRGLYEMDFVPPETGSCELRVSDKSGGRFKRVGLDAGFPKEYLLGAEREKAFEELPRIKSDDVLEGLKPRLVSRPLRNILCVLALCCLFLGILLRRL